MKPKKAKKKKKILSSYSKVPVQMNIHSLHFSGIFTEK